MVMCLCMCDQKSGLSVSYATVARIHTQLPGYTHTSDSNWCSLQLPFLCLTIQVVCPGSWHSAGCVAHGYMFLLPPERFKPGETC